MSSRWAILFIPLIIGTILLLSPPTHNNLFTNRDLASISTVELNREKFPSSFDSFLREKGEGMPEDMNQLLTWLEINGSRIRDNNLEHSSASVLIPFGRSLQKDHSNFEKPRVVYAVNSPKGPFFIGYTDATKSAEIISWVPKLRLYRFDLLQGLAANQSTQLHLADRNLCLSCHQGEAPLFPRSPWREIGLSRVYRGLDRYHNPDDIYFGYRFPHSFSGLTVPAFLMDGMIRDANFRLLISRGLTGLCGENRECQKTLILNAFLYPYEPINSRLGSPYAEENLGEENKRLGYLLQLLRSNGPFDSSDAIQVSDRQLLNGWIQTNPYRQRIENSVLPLWPEQGLGLISSSLPDRSMDGLNSSGHMQSRSTYRIHQRLPWSGEEATYDDSVSLFVRSFDGPVDESINESGFDTRSNTTVRGRSLSERRFFNSSENENFSSPSNRRPVTMALLSSDGVKLVTTFSAFALGLKSAQRENLIRTIRREYERLFQQGRLGPAPHMMGGTDFRELAKTRLENLILSDEFTAFLASFSQFPPVEEILGVLDRLAKKTPYSLAGNQNYFAASELTHTHAPEETLDEEERLRIQQPFVYHCGYCHGLAPATLPTDPNELARIRDELALPLDNSDALRAYRGIGSAYLNKSISELINQDLMPLGETLSQEDKNCLLRYLQGQACSTN